MRCHLERPIQGPDNLPAAYIPHMAYSLIEERSFAPAVLEAMGVLAKPLRGRLRERNLPRKGLIAPASVPG